MSTEANCCKITSRNISESFPNTISLVPSCVSNTVPIDTRNQKGENETGKLTGIVIFGKSNLVMREKRWKKRNSRLAVVKQSKKDLTAYALEKTLQLQEHGEIVFTRATDDNNNLRPIVPKNFSLLTKFEEGWALRKGPGHMYGEKYTRHFRGDIEDQYQMGEIASNAKSSPAKILEFLKNKYPEELCLPSESDIGAEISRLMAMKRKKEGTVVNATGPKKKTNNIYSSKRPREDNSA